MFKILLHSQLPQQCHHNNVFTTIFPLLSHQIHDKGHKGKTFTLTLRAMGCHRFSFTDILCRYTISIYLVLFYISLKQLCTHFWSEKDQSFAAVISWMLVFWCRQVFNISLQINRFITSLLRYETQNGHTIVHVHDI